jgi:hypothetical protein
MMRLMTFERPKEFLVEHKGATAAVVGSIAAAGAAGTAGYLLYRKHKLAQEQNLEEIRAEEYEDQLAIFENPRLDAETRYNMALVATHVFYAADLTGDPIVGRKELLAHIREAHDETMTRSRLEPAIGYLKDYDLLGRQHRADNRQSAGYVTMPAMEWGLKYSDRPHELLHQVEGEIVAELTGN